MNHDDKQELLGAVNALITSPDAFDLFESLEVVGQLASRQPVALTGSAAILNPLLKLRVADKEAYARVLDLIDSRRAALLYEPLQKPTDTGYNKVEYMRGFMEQKRQRERRAVEIENMLRPPRDRLVGNARLEFMRRQSAKWKDLRDAFVAKAKEAAGGSLTKDQQQTVLSQFWKAVDDDLDTRFETAKLDQLKPASQRAPRDVSLASLTDALQFDPYKK